MIREKKEPRSREYGCTYDSPMGKIAISGTEEAITGVWLPNQKYYEDNWRQAQLGTHEELPLFVDVRRWLTIYFSGKEPDFMVPLRPCGSDFRKLVWNHLLEIPYGGLTTYGEIARRIAEKKGISRMSAQAVGGAVGHNPISILIPCHRVIGSDKSLTGYGGGIDKKIKLLETEGIDTREFSVPQRGTAL